MASRFTSSTAKLNADGATKSDGNLLHRPAPKPEDPAEQAAKLGMYGPMTRSSAPFYPSRLLCKRFNVAPPPDAPPASSSRFDDEGRATKTTEAVSKDAMEKLKTEMAMHGFSSLRRPVTDAVAGSTGAAATSVPVPGEHARVDVEENEVLSRERAPEDVFKSIFGNEDEDED